MKTIQKIAAFICGMVLAFSSAAAEDSSGFYVSPEIGKVTVKDYCIAGLDSCEDSGIGYGLISGYRFNEFLAIETGIRYVSGFDRKGTLLIERGSEYHIFEGFKADAPAVKDQDTKFASFALGARGYLPIGERFFVTAKAGFHYIFEKSSASVVGESTSGVSMTVSDSVYSKVGKPYFGAGGGFSFTDNISGLVEYSRFLGNEVDMDIISASAVFHF